MFKMNQCREKDCQEERKIPHYLCDHHINEQVKIKNILIENRMKDPQYMTDSLLFVKCAKLLIPFKFEDDDDSDDDEAKFYLDHRMHDLLFDDYYNQPLSRTQVLIEKIKELHKDCCALENGLESIEYEIHDYQVHVEFLTKWIEESEIIEKTKLIKQLDMVEDVQTMIQRIITTI